METVRFGRTGVRVPKVSIGTWSHGGPNVAGDRAVGWTGGDLQAERASLRDAWAVGITHWDTADVYGDGRSERLIGSMWDEVPRADIFLASKVGWDAGAYEHFYHPEQVAKQLQGSLERLRTDVIDLYYLHHSDFGPGDRYLDGALEVLRAAQQTGKIRFIGLSDWDAHKVVRVLERVDPDVVQPYRNVVDTAYVSSGLAELVRQRDLGVAFFSPIRHGLLLGKYTQPTRFEAGDFRSGDAWFGDAAILRALQDKRDALEARFGNHPEPALRGLLMSLLADSPTGCVLLGQRNPRQVAAAAAAARPISAEDAAWVQALYADLGA